MNFPCLASAVPQPVQVMKEAVGFWSESRNVLDGFSFSMGEGT